MPLCTLTNTSSSFPGGTESNGGILVVLDCTRLSLCVVGGHQQVPKSRHGDISVVTKAWPSLGSFMTNSF